MIKLDNPAPPNLPLAPSVYDQTYFESLTNTLRLYFNRIENVTRNLLGPEGGIYLNLPYGSFYDTADQTAATTTTAYAHSPWKCVSAVFSSETLWKTAATGHPTRCI